MAEEKEEGSRRGTWVCDLCGDNIKMPVLRHEGENVLYKKTEEYKAHDKKHSDKGELYSWTKYGPAINIFSDKEGRKKKIKSSTIFFLICFIYVIYSLFWILYSSKNGIDQPLILFPKLFLILESIFIATALICRSIELRGEK